MIIIRYIVSTLLVGAIILAISLLPSLGPWVMSFGFSPLASYIIAAAILVLVPLLPGLFVLSRLR